MKTILEDYKTNLAYWAEIGLEPMSLQDFANAWPWIKTESAADKWERESLEGFKKLIEG